MLGESRASFDPPEKGFDRLKEQLQAIKPTVALLAYGMAESFKGQAGLETFKQDIARLIDTIEEISKPDSVRFIIATPLMHESRPAPLPDPASHNAQLRLYAQALRDIAKSRNATLVDVFESMEAYHTRQNARPFTDNGIHPTPFGFWQLASFFERELGLYPGATRIGFNSNATLREGSSGINASEIKLSDSSLRFKGEEQYFGPLLRPADVGETITSPGLMMQVPGLKPGNYTLKIDG